MDKEVGLVFAVSFLEVAVGFDVLEAHFAHQLTRVVLAPREHVEMIDRTIGELVAEACQPLVDEFVPLIDKAPDVFIFVLVGLAYRFGVMAVFLPLLFLLGKNSRILDRSLFFAGSD